jgi:hypothetical protein
MADWSSLYYKQVTQNPNRVSTTGYTAFAFMMAFGRLIGDWFTAKLGYKGILMLDSLLIASGLGLAIGFQHPLTCHRWFWISRIWGSNNNTYCIFSFRTNKDDGNKHGAGGREYGWVYRIPGWTTNYWFYSA